MLFRSDIGQEFHTLYLSFILIATICYGINVNMVNKYLKDIGSLQIAALALSLNGILALIILYFTGYFSLSFSDAKVLHATFYTGLLGIFGTALASITFYMLMKRAGAIFASMVTYGIPFVAIMWGLIYGENIGIKQIGCLMLILLGVF